MTTNNGTTTITPTTDPVMKDLLTKELRATGQDIAPGSYAGVLFAFGEPFKLKVAEQFRKEGGPAERLVFELHFAIKVKGTLASVPLLVPVPEGGAANRRSNVYKALHTLRGNDRKFFDGEGEFAKGINLEAFLGSTATVQVKKNKKDFPQVEALSAPIDGMTYPTIDEAKVLNVEVTASENIPF